MKGKYPKVAGVLQTELMLRAARNEESLGPADDYVAGFIEGSKMIEIQNKEMAEALLGLINIASQRQEFNSLAYARYLLKRLGYDIKRGA